MLEMPRRKRTHDELREASKRIYYSVDMLLGTGRLLDAGGNDRWSANAYLETFTVHARALIHFIEPAHPHQDDILAADFFDDPSQWEATRSRWYFPVDYVRRRVGKEIVHLTYASTVTDEERTVGADRGDAFYYGAIRTSIVHAIDQFRRCVAPQTLDAKWTELELLR